jgi:hypothetical protein
MAEPTSYIVLRRFKIPAPTTSSSAVPHRATEQWDRVTEVEARSAEHAIRLYAESAAAEASGTFVAVPMRSWKPVTVKAETTTVLKLETA